MIQLSFPTFHDFTIPLFQIHGTENRCKKTYACKGAYKFQDAECKRKQNNGILYGSGSARKPEKL